MCVCVCVRACVGGSLYLPDKEIKFQDWDHVKLNKKKSFRVILKAVTILFYWNS